MRTVLALLVVTLATAAGGDALDAALQRQLKAENTPGLSFAVVRHGRIVRTGAYGMANLEWHAAVTPDTKFEIASISKMFAGAAVRILVDERKVDPEEPLSTYFQGMPATWTGMKVRHLITMNSGLPDDWATDLIPYDDDVTTKYDDASMLRTFFTIKMEAPLGERYVYSSPNYAMLAMIVAKVAGTPFTQFVRDRILQPAGMTNTSYIDNAVITPNRANGYRLTPEGELRNGWFLGQYLHARPDVGLLSTAPDLARWIIALENRTIVKDPETLWTFPDADSGRPLDYAYGWMRDTWLGHRRLSHSGGFRTGFHTFIARYPDDDLGIVVLTNCDESMVRDSVNTIAAAYLPSTPDPAHERTRPDADPEDTLRMAAALQSVAHGVVDESAMFADAIEPFGLADTAAFLKDTAPFTYAGRARVGAHGLILHRRTLVDFVTLRGTRKGHVLYVTLYRDANGKIAYLEATN